MAVCAKLHKTEEEIEHWTTDRLAYWLAYFKLTEDERQRQIKIAQDKSKRSPTTPRAPRKRKR